MPATDTAALPRVPQTEMGVPLSQMGRVRTREAVRPDGSRVWIRAEHVVEGLEPDPLDDPVHTPASPEPVAAPAEVVYVAPVDYAHAGTVTVPSGEKARVRANLAALDTLATLAAENRYANAAEQHTLAAWSGWGGCPTVFDPDRDDWATEREQLQAVMSPEQYAAAKASTLNAHYTDPAIAAAMWEALAQAGFEGGRVLEPGCGSGNFIGLAPASATMVGVEIDPTSAQIAHYLYPVSAQIRNEGFEKTRIRDGSFTAAIGNVPFGGFALSDPVHNAAGHSIHNHFILKSLHLTAPGGYAALITSSYTLDALDAKARREMHEAAELVAAVRLPSKAFQRVAATQVVTDVLVFRRRAEHESVPHHAGVDWLHTDTATVPDRNGIDTDVTINRWFANRPELVLGDMRADHGMYRDNQLVITHDDLARVPAQVRQTLAPMIAAAVADGRGLRARVHATSRGATPAIGLVTAQDLYAADQPVGRVTYHPDTDLFTRRGLDGEPVPMNVPRTRVTETKHLLRLRDLFENTIASQKAHAPAADRDGLRADLNIVYDAYVAAYGPINRSKRTGGAERTAEQAAAKLDTLETRWRLANADRDTGEPYAGDLPEDVAADFEEQAWTASPVVNRQTHLEALRNDPSLASLLSLEEVDSETGAMTKAAIFSRDVVVAPIPAASADSPEEAVAISVGENGQVRLDRIAELLAQDTETARESIRGLVFADLDQPRTLVPAGSMLSGNVRAKYERAAQLAAQEPGNRDWTELASALRAVIPVDKSPSQIGDVSIGATWIPQSDYARFAEDVFELGDVTIEHSAAGWVIDARAGRWGTKNRTEYGFELKGKSREAVELFEAALNQRPVVITNTKTERENNGKPEIDEEATAMAAVQMRKIRDEFRTWLWSDTARAQRLAAEWNKRFNAWVAPRHDGTYLQLPGLSPAFKPHPYQRNAVARIAAEPTVLLDHVVGAGKTGSMFMAAAELKRRGLVRQPWIVVPTHLIEQMGREVKQWYPAARVLVGAKGMDAADRRLFAAQTATSDWDMVIVPSSVFERINVAPERRKRYIETQKQDLENELLKLREGARPSQRTIKGIETAKKRLERSLDALMKSEGKDSGVVTFEMTGADYLMVDEAHEYKNKARTTPIESLAHTGSQKAEDLALKLAVLREQFADRERAAGRNVTPGAERVATFATGTPIANSLAEAWVMQSYLRPDILDAAGVRSVTDWAASFTTTKQETITNTSGTKLKVVNRVSAFANPREMFAMSATYTDVVTRAQVPAELPTVAGHTITVPSSQQMRDFTADLDWRLDHADPRRPDLDNVLKVLNDGRNAALDPRLANLPAPAPQHSRVQAVADNVAEVYHRTAANRYKTATGERSDTPGALQLVFCDRGTPRADGGWSVYDGMREAMVAAGVPRESIAFIHEAKTAQQRGTLQEACRSGRINILIGSTPKMGTGLNVQQRMAALHHVDVPWRPADLEQREGRGIRQGNQNTEFEVFRYVVEGTTDTVMWSKVESKAAFIEQAKNGQLDDSVTTVDDIEEESLSSIAAATKAAATGDMRFITLIEQQEQLKELKAQAAAAREARWTATARVREARGEIPRLHEQLAVIERLTPTVQRWETAGKHFTVNGRSFVERTDRASALLERARATYTQLKGAGSTKSAPIAELAGGVNVLLSRSLSDDKATVFLDIPGEPYFHLDRDSLWPPQSAAGETSTVGLRSGLATRIENLYARLPVRAESVQRRIRQAEADIAAFEPKMNAPFAREADLAAVEMTVDKLTRELAADQNTPEAIAAREAAALRMAEAGRQPGWTLELNPTTAMVAESGFESTAHFVAASQRMHIARAHNYASQARAQQELTSRPAVHAELDAETLEALSDSGISAMASATDAVRPTGPHTLGNTQGSRARSPQMYTSGPER